MKVDKENTSFKQRKILIFMFVFVFLLIGFFTFFEDFSFTGMGISGGSSSNGSIEIGAVLNIPSLDLNSKFDEVSFVAEEDGFVEVGDVNVAFEKGSELVFRGFDGRIGFDDEGINDFKGKAEKVVVDGDFIFPNSNELTKVEISEEFSYSELNVKDSLFLRKLDYFASGTLKLNDKKIFSLNNESLYMKNFHGSVFVENDFFKIEGFVDKVEIEGDSRVSVY